MLVQRYQRAVPGHDASLRRTVFRDESFRIAVMVSRGIANDFGVYMQTVACQAQARRSQLSILLAGRGYFAPHGRTIELSPGAVVASDQAEQEAEGYAGTPCEVIVLEWDPDDLFEPGPRGPAQTARLSRAAVERLRALVARSDEGSAAAWVVELLAVLRASGLPLRGELDRRALSAPAPHATTYGALGDALARLDAQPTLTELAETLGVTERQAHRRLAELLRDYGVPFDGWRDFVNESRIEWTLQVLSVAGLSQERAARVSGFRSSTALHHALSLRGAATPGALAKVLRQRWG